MCVCERERELCDNEISGVLILAATHITFITILMYTTNTNTNIVTLYEFTVLITMENLHQENYLEIITRKG